jgi:murein DD-endopeptidase MepM/ murein hydrolase activator NlpD
MATTGALVQSVSAGLPDVQETIGRATNYYQAAIRNRASTQRIANATFSALQGGLTGRGSDAAVAATLASQGMYFSEDPNSTYMQTLSGVKNAAQYLNMDNVAAANAISGLTSGQGSMNMLTQMGIYTSDPRTGKAYTQGQIFEQMYQRMTAGREGATVEETMESIRRGNLGATLRGLGLTEDQQELFKQFAIEKAGGKSMDLSSNAAMESMMGERDTLGKNPQLPGMAINTLDTDLMAEVTDSYIKGMEEAVDGIGVLVEAFKKLPKIALEFESYYATLQGSQTGQSIATLAQLMPNAVLGVGVLAAFKGLAPFLASLGLRPETASPTTSSSDRAEQLRADKAAEARGSTGSGSAGGGSAGGGGGGGGGGGVGGSSFLGSLGASVGSGGGSGLSIGAPGNSAAGRVGTGTKSADSVSAKKDRPQFQKPSNGTITSGYGPRERAGKVGSTDHKGVDYAPDKGPEVFAAADGVVSKIGSNMDKNSGYGHYVVIDHAAGFQTLYAHFSNITVGNQASVKKGQQIGVMGSTGASTGVHLHFEVKKNNSYIDPLSVVGGSAPKSGSHPGSTSGSTKGSSSSSKSASHSGPPGSLSTFGSSYQGAVGAVDVSGIGLVDVAGALSSVSMGPSLWSLKGVWDSGGGTPSRRIYDPNAPRAKTGDPYVANDGPVNVHAGEAILTAEQADQWRSEMRGEKSSSKNNVVINVQLSNSSDSEARRLATMVKQYLEEDSILDNMGRR